MSIHTLHDGSFDHVIASSPIPVVVLFTSPTCVPCKRMTLVLEEVAEEYEGEIHVTRLDITESPKTANRFQISTVPTVLIFNEGKPVETLIGVQTLDKICDAVEGILESA